MTVNHMTRPWSAWGSAAGGLATVGAISALLTAPALWNGIPLFFYDSVDYLRLSFTFELPAFRTAGYGVFAGFGRMFGTPWAVIAVQALMVAYTLWMAARTFCPRLKPLALVAMVGALCLVTGLPWYTSQLMADAFSGAFVLGIATIALREGRLARPGQLLLIIVTAVGIAVHTTHVAVAAGLIALLGVLTWLRQSWRALPKIRLGPPVGAVVVALGLAVAANWSVTGRVFLVQPNQNLMLGLFLQNGLAKRYLDDVCAKQPDTLQLCGYRDRLPTDAGVFLWGHDSLFEQLGGWASPRLASEADSVVKGSIAAYRTEFVRLSAAFSARQLVMVASGDGLNPMHRHLERSIRDFYPSQVAAFLAAPQQRDGIDLRRLHPIESVVYFGSALLLPVLAWRWRAGDDGQAIMLSVLVIAALLGNAVVCGAGSAPFDRYQGRMAWLPAFALALVAVRLATGRQDNAHRPGDSLRRRPSETA